MAISKATDQSSDPVRPEELASTPLIRIVIADTAPIFRVGMKKIFTLEDDLRVVAQCEGLRQTITTLSKFPADVLLLEAAMCPDPAVALSKILKRWPELRIIVVAAVVDEDHTVEYLRRGVSGIVTRSISPDLLLRCVRKVAGGETWLDNEGVTWVIEAFRDQAVQLTAPRVRARLSNKELLIISGVTQGLKNKDIAQEIGTTEQVVKNYLRKVYDKLGVSERFELALYCMHHRLLENFHKGAKVPDKTIKAKGTDPGS